MEACKIYGTSKPRTHAQGLKGKEISSPSSQREKKCLDFTSYRSRYFNSRQSSLCPVIRVISHATTAHTPGNAVRTTEKTTPAL